MSKAGTRLTSPADVRRLAEAMGFQPRRALGQNFLIDRNIRDLLLKAADVSRRDTVLEIGPGLGVLTEALLATAGRVVAVEKDKRLAAFLRSRLGEAHGLELVRADMLDLDVSSIAGSGDVKVVANLPYSVGTRILMDLVTSEGPPSCIVVTVQHEVAQRLTAKEGSRTYGLASVWTRLAYDADVVKTVSPSCFWPRPEVTSAIVAMHRRRRPRMPRRQREKFYEWTRLAFSQRRKQIANVLGGRRGVPGLTPGALRLVLEREGIAVTARPESLSVRAWCGLVNALTAPGGHTTQGES